MSRDLKKLLKAANRTIALINLGHLMVSKPARDCLMLYSNDLQGIVRSTEKRKTITSSDEMIYTELLAGTIQSAWSILCSDGSLNCLINL